MTIAGAHIVFRKPGTTGTAVLRFRPPAPEMYYGFSAEFGSTPDLELTQLLSTYSSFGQDYAPMVDPPPLIPGQENNAYWLCGWDSLTNKKRQFQLAELALAAVNEDPPYANLGVWQKMINDLNDLSDPFFNAKIATTFDLAFPSTNVYLPDLWTVDILITQADSSTMYWSNDLIHGYFGWIAPIHQDYDGVFWFGKREEICFANQRFNFKDR